MPAGNQTLLSQSYDIKAVERLANEYGNGESD